MPKLPWLAGFIFYSLGLIWSESALAQSELRLFVQEDLPVYSSLGPQKKQLYVLKLGDEVRISRIEKFGSRRVILFIDGQRRLGYVEMKDLRLSYTKEIVTGNEARPNPNQPPSRWSARLSFSQLSQGPRSFTASDETSVYQIGELKSEGFILGISWQTFFGPEWGLEIFASLRQARFKGLSYLNATPIETETRQLLGDLGFQMKRYYQHQIWWGIGSLGAGGTEVEVYFNDIKADVSEKTRPLYWFSFLSAGFDRDISKKWVGSLEGRYGVSLVNRPNTSILEATLGLAYKW